MSKGIIAVGSDHGGLELKRLLCQALSEWGWQVQDLGCESPESVDYPDYARAVAEAVAGEQARFGLLVCGSGIGMCITANKVSGVRAALCHECYSARMSRLHNDANVICMGGRVVGPDLARSVLESFLSHEFEGGRHERRLGKIAALERHEA